MLILLFVSKAVLQFFTKEKIKCSGRIIFPGANKAALFITFFNSLTLPGHEYDISFLIAAGVQFLMDFPNSTLNSFIK